MIFSIFLLKIIKENDKNHYVEQKKLSEKYTL